MSKILNKDNSLNQEFESYLACCFGSQMLDQDQKRELYLSFLAGAMKIFTVCTHDIRDMSPKEATSKLSSLMQEIIDQAKKANSNR